MSDLFGNPDTTPAEYPDDALCVIDGCGHENAAHKRGKCERCQTNRARGFAVDPDHEFKPRLLGGRVVTPSTERELLEKVRRGE